MRRPSTTRCCCPDGADTRFADAAALWNAAEAAERRKDSQVAREIVLALPADRVLSTEDRIELARSFAAEHFVSKGLAVQLDVHAPHKERGEGEGALAEGTGGDHTNWHAHLLITTRRIEGDQLSAKKARDLDPEVRRAGTRALVTDAEAWGETWRAHQDRYFLEHGIALRVDATAAHPGEHIGPVRMRKVDSPAAERAEVLRQSNEAAARDPEQVLAALTRNNATFTERELDRYLLKHLGAGPDGTKDAAAAADIAAAKAAVLTHPTVLALHDKETGAQAERFTTTTVRAQEREALADGAAVAGARHHQGVKARYQEAALASRTLREDQRAAFEHAVGAGGLKLIEGRAGTGKSYTLAAVREAHEAAGYRIVGLAPTNAVAQDLKADGFREAGTVHAALFAIKNGRSPGWNRRTVLVVDEAAMLDSRVTGELLAEAKRAGAKVILTGDDRQLASIERGGLFTELRRTHGAAEITEVTRQRVAWQRQAARDLAEGRFDAAVQAFDRHGAVTWTADRGGGTRRTGHTVEGGQPGRPAGEPVRVRLHQRRGGPAQRRPAPGAAGPGRVGQPGRGADHQAWRGGVRGRRPGAVHRHRQEARRLQRQCRRGHRAGRRHRPGRGPAGRRGRQGGPLRHLVGGGRVRGVPARLRRDDLQGPGQDAGPHLPAAHAPLAGGGELRGADPAAGKRPGVRGDGDGPRRPSARAADGAGRGAGGVRRVGHGGRAAAGAAARPGCRKGRASPRLPGALMRQPFRPGVILRVSKQASAQGTAHLIRPGLRQNQPGQRRSRPDRAAADVWLIPPRMSLDGKDSLGRGLDAGSVAAMVAGDTAVQREREARWSYLQGAYREPHAARAALDEMVKREGWTSAAARLAREPEQLGELRGKVGWLASAAAKQERAAAERAASALPGSLERVGEAQGRASRAYRASVEGQLAADAVGIPRLSATAEAAIGALRVAADDGARAQAWRAAQQDERIAAELGTFREAVALRFGEEGVRQMLRAGGQPGAVQVPSVVSGQRPALDQAADAVVTLRTGERAYAGLAQREREQQEQSQRRGMRM